MPAESAGPVHIRLPRALLAYWTGPPSIDVPADTLAAAFDALETRHPGLAARILDDQGRIRRHVAVFVNGDLMDHRDAATIPLHPGDQVHVVPSISGG